MKKLLSLLSVLTISGTAIPTTIAASPYQKKINNAININYLQKNNIKRSKRSVEEEINKVYFIDNNGLVRKETDVPYPITTMYVFKDPDSGQRKYGDIYFGTINGIYLRKAGESTTTKIEGINEPIKLISSYANSGQVHVINNKGEVYFIDNNGLVRKETDVPYPITTMYVFKDPDSGQRKYGDIYFGTINGIYLRKAGESTTTKIEGINEPIKLISSYANSGQVHVINNKGEIYFIDNNGLVRKETDVPYPITTMYVFKDPDSGQRKYGDIYFGTINGIYLRKAGESTTTKIEGINEPIKLISSYANSGQVHVINNKGEIYFIDNNGLVRKETDVPYPITTMYVFKDPDSGQRKYGDIYFGTINGIYLRKAGESTTTKIEGINEPIKLISSYANSGQVHVIIDETIKKIIRTEKYEVFVTFNNELYYKKGSQKIKKHSLFGLVEGKVNKIEADLNNNFYILLNNKELWRSDYNFASIENGVTIFENKDDNKIKDFIIDKFNNIFVLTEKNNVYYKRKNDNQFNKLNIFTQNEQINNILYNKEAGITFLTKKSPIFINNDQIDDLIKNNNCEIQYPHIRTERVAYNNIIKTDEFIINSNLTSDEYKSFIKRIRDFLIGQNIIITLANPSMAYETYELVNNSKKPYFIVRIKLENNKTLELVFRSSDLYLQGFINEQNGQRHYYHFMSQGTENAVLESIEGINTENTHDLRVEENYNSLVPAGGNARSRNFNSYDILNAFKILSEYNQNRGWNYENSVLFHVILATSEALRFNAVVDSLSSLFRNYLLSFNFNYFEPLITHWNDISRENIMNSNYWTGVSEYIPDSIINNNQEENIFKYFMFAFSIIAIFIYTDKTSCK